MGLRYMPMKVVVQVHDMVDRVKRFEGLPWTAMREVVASASSHCPVPVLCHVGSSVTICVSQPDTVTPLAAGAGRTACWSATAPEAAAAPDATAAAAASAVADSGRAAGAWVGGVRVRPLVGGAGGGSAPCGRALSPSGVSSSRREISVET